MVLENWLSNADHLPKKTRSKRLTDCAGKLPKNFSQAVLIRILAMSQVVFL